MTMPAEVTTDAAWDRLITTLRAQYRYIDDLYQHITEPEPDADENDEPEERQPVTDPDMYPEDADDRAADDRAAIEEDERRVRVDAETDGRLDGDYDIDAYDEPGLED
jgi:hypothetical protein